MLTRKRKAPLFQVELLRSRYLFSQAVARQVLSAQVILTSVFELGSDGSAASGGRSDLSEWQRSTAEEGFSKPTKMSGTATGNRWALHVFPSKKKSSTFSSGAFMFALLIFPAQLPCAASGRYSKAAGCAAVDKIEDQRKPEDFIGYRKPDQSPAKYCRRR